MASCDFCGHEESEHCKGNQKHTDHKEDSRMTPTKYRTGTHFCVSRHCEQPLCCCVDYLGPKVSQGRETNAELEEFAELIARDDSQERRKMDGARSFQYRLVKAL